MKYTFDRKYRDPWFRKFNNQWYITCSWGEFKGRPLPLIDKSGKPIKGFENHEDAFAVAKWLDDLSPHERLNVLKARLKPLAHTIREQVYFAGDRDREHVKIGFSVNPMDRVSRLQTGTPFPLILYATIHNSEPQKYERILHKRFSSYKTWGEWFKVEGELEKFLNEIAPK